MHNQYNPSKFFSNVKLSCPIRRQWWTDVHINQACLNRTIGLEISRIAGRKKEKELWWKYTNGATFLEAPLESCIFWYHSRGLCHIDYRKYYTTFVLCMQHCIGLFSYHLKADIDVIIRIIRLKLLLGHFKDKRNLDKKFC